MMELQQIVRQLISTMTICLFPQRNVMQIQIARSMMLMLQTYHNSPIIQLVVKQTLMEIVQVMEPNF